MSFNVTFKRSVAKDLRRIDRLRAKRILDRIESTLPARALEFPELGGKFAGLRKFRIGSYRVIYTILGENVLILRISHRKEAYDRET